jgi:hypothetical protein
MQIEVVLYIDSESGHTTYRTNPPGDTCKEGDHETAAGAVRMALLRHIDSRMSRREVIDAERDRVTKEIVDIDTLLGTKNKDTK